MMNRLRNSGKRLSLPPPYCVVICSVGITFYCLWMLYISAVSRAKKSHTVASLYDRQTAFTSQKNDQMQPPLPENNQSSMIEKDTSVDEKASSESKVPAARKDLPEWIEDFQSEAGGTPAGWPAPEWCSILKESPRERPRGPIFNECGRKHNHVLCADGKPMFFGSHNQDMHTWAQHFRHLKRPGIFVDIAANDPVSRSNTFFYERCLGWKGVCVEANPKYFPRLRNNRTCALVKRCVSNKEETVEFIDDNGTGGISTTNKNRWVHKKSRRSITCIPTRTAIKYGFGEEKLSIDFMSLDVEGHELPVLQGINWDTTKINMITIENRSHKIRDFLLERGYNTKSMDRDGNNKVLYGQMWNDILYVHESVVWGSPV